MGWIANDGLIEVAYLDLDLAGSICHRPQISDVAIAADPYRRPVRQ